MSLFNGAEIGPAGPHGLYTSTLLEKLREPACRGCIVAIFDASTIADEIVDKTVTKDSEGNIIYVDLVAAEEALVESLPSLQDHLGKGACSGLTVEDAGRELRFEDRALPFRPVCPLNPNNEF